MSAAREDISGRLTELAWNRYRSVVADLSEITEEIGSLRLVPT